MNDIDLFMEKHSAEIKDLFNQLKQIILATSSVEEKLWAKLPSYYNNEKFVRLIPFKDHINIEASAMINHEEELPGYTFTPKHFLQLKLKDNIPTSVLATVFKETLTE